MQLHSDYEERFYKLLLRPQVGMILYAALDLKIPQILESGPKTISELSQATATNESKLLRALNALVSEKIFDYIDGKFAINYNSEILLNQDYADYIKIPISPWFYDLLSVNKISLYDHKSSSEIKYQQTMNDYLGHRCEIAKEMSDAYWGDIRLNSSEILPKINLDNAHKILDVGGHCGGLLIELAKKYTKIEGTVYDQTLYRQFILKNIKDNNLSDRIKVAVGNYLDSIPQGFDTILLKCVTSDNNDVNLVKLLRNIKNVMSSDDKFYVIDMLFDKNIKFTRYVNVFQTTLFDGKLRNRDELLSFIESNGFRVLNISQTKVYTIFEMTI